MKKLTASDRVYIARSGIANAGRGVFAAREIKSNELIEKCPIIEVSEHEVPHLSESSLVNYFYYFGDNKEHLLIALGFGSIYNHTYEPNAKYQINPEEGTIDFIAVKHIKKDIEITVNYANTKSEAKNPLWFE